MHPPPSISVSSTINTPIILQKALDLAKKLDLPFFAPEIPCATDLLLAYTEHGLQLLQPMFGAKHQRCLLYVDFVYGKNGYRLAKDCTTQQPLARAVGIKGGKRPSIFDSTGGLGGDAFVLASLGCKVTICERSPIIAALLEDGLNRGLLAKKTADIIAERIRLIVGDSQEYLQQCSEIYTVIYLDPMYPHRQDSALNRQTMRIIRSIVGDDQDSGQLLITAINKAENRAVVKRPDSALPLTDQRPSHKITMKNSRFDIYLTFNDQPA